MGGGCSCGMVQELCTCCAVTNSQLSALQLVLKGAVGNQLLAYAGWMKATIWSKECPWKVYTNHDESYIWTQLDS